MSQLKTGSEPTADDANGRFFRSLRKTAEMHDISPSYLSRCVRERESAKGHDLCSYVLFEETGDEKKVFGFAFPPGYEPADSAVGGNEHDRQQEPSGNGGATGAVHRRDESYRTEEGSQGLATNWSLSEDSPDEVSRVQEDIDDLKDDVGELESVITEVANALGQIAQELAESRGRRERIAKEISDLAGEIQRLRWNQKETLSDLRRWIRGRFDQARKDRVDKAEITDTKIERLSKKITRLPERIETVVDRVQEKIDRDRERDLRDLSDELQKEIRDPILEMIAHDDEGEDGWTTALGFGMILTVVELLDKRPDLILQAVRALGGGGETGGVPLSPPPADEDAQENSGTESG